MQSSDGAFLTNEYEFDIAAEAYFKVLASNQNSVDDNSIARRLLRTEIEQHKTSQLIQMLCRRVTAIEGENSSIDHRHGAKVQDNNFSSMEGGTPQCIKQLFQEMEKQVKLTETLTVMNGTGYEYYEGLLQKLENDFRHAIEATAEDIKRLRAEFAATPVGEILPPATDPPNLVLDETRISDGKDPPGQPREDALVEDVAEVVDRDLVQVFALSTSTWDVCLFLGSHTPVIDLIFSAVVFLLNVGMQVIFAEIVWKKMATSDKLDEETVHGYATWRMVAGHNADYYDLISGTSLVTRVCNGSPTTVLAANELSLHDYYMEYITDNTGHVMCILSLLVWLLTVCKELLATGEYLKMLYFANMSDSKTTEIYSDEGVLRIRSIGRIRRCALVLIVVVPRLEIVSILGAGGMLYLSYTKSVTELLLNTLALGFVLDLDEFLFDLLMPDAIQQLVEEANGVELAPSCFTTGKSGTAKHVLAALLVIGTLIIANFKLVAPEIELMKDMLTFLCDGNQNFVYSLDKATGAAFAATTKKEFMPYADFKETPIYKAVLQRTELKEPLQSGMAGTWAAMILTTLNRTAFVPHTFRLNIVGDDVTGELLEGEWKFFGPYNTFKGIATLEVITLDNGETKRQQRITLNSPSVWQGQVLRLGEQWDELHFHATVWTRHGVQFRETSTALVMEKHTQTNDQSLNSHRCQDVSATYYLSVMIRHAVGNHSVRDCRDLFPRCSETAVQTFCPITCRCQQGALGLVLRAGSQTWYPTYLRKGCGNRCSTIFSLNVQYSLTQALNVTKTCVDSFTELVLQWHGTVVRKSSYDAFFDGVQAYLLEKRILVMEGGVLHWGHTADGITLSTYVHRISNRKYSVGLASSVKTWVQRAIELKMTDCSVIQLIYGVFNMDLCKLSPKYGTVQIVCPITCQVCDAAPAQGEIKTLLWDDYYNISETLGISALRRIST